MKVPEKCQDLKIWKPSGATIKIKQFFRPMIGA